MTDFSRRGFLAALRDIGIGAAVLPSVITDRDVGDETPVVEEMTGDSEGQTVIVENTLNKRRTIKAHEFELRQHMDPVDITSDGSLFGYGGPPADDFKQHMAGPIRRDVTLKTVDPMSLNDVLLVVPLEECEYQIPIRFLSMRVTADENNRPIYECFATVTGQVIRKS